MDKRISSSPTIIQENEQTLNHKLYSPSRCWVLKCNEYFLLVQSTNNTSLWKHKWLRSIFPSPSPPPYSKKDKIITPRDFYSAIASAYQKSISTILKCWSMYRNGKLHPTPLLSSHMKRWASTWEERTIRQGRVTFRTNIYTYSQHKCWTMLI